MNATPPFVRSTENVGNIVHLEHVNLTIPEQRPATIFYVSGLGLTRDPYLVTGVTNMWINAGQSQFHLPIGKPQRFRGRIGLVIPDRESLLKRLGSVTEMLAGTEFKFSETPDYIETTCPWGNSIRCYEPNAERFGDLALGIPYLEFIVPSACAAPIVDFYRDVFDAHGHLEVAAEGLNVGRIPVGVGQHLIFRETKAPIPPYDGHHIQIYIHNFSRPHARLMELGLITEESNEHQYRFMNIVNLATRAECFKIEHEVRSMRHPLYARPLVNRNPNQTNNDYVRGRDDFVR